MDTSGARRYTSFSERVEPAGARAPALALATYSRDPLFLRTIRSHVDRIFFAIFRRNSPALDRGCRHRVCYFKCPVISLGFTLLFPVLSLFPVPLFAVPDKIPYGGTLFICPPSCGVSLFSGARSHAGDSRRGFYRTAV